MTAKGSGTGYIVASCEGVGTTVIAVNVAKEGKYVVPDCTLEYGEKMPMEAEAEYEAAEKAYMEVLASEESDLAAVKAALSRLHNAEKLLNNAKDELKRIKDIFSAEEMAQANDKIIQL